jgi:DNA-binding response OmpR family regulator
MGDWRMEQQLVIIADDDPQIREILRIYLEKEGYAAEEAQDGAQAILKVQSAQPALLLLDIMMPVLDGIEVCRQVRKISKVPIIMITARDEDDERILGLDVGADDYITKPFNPREVMARVKAVLRRAVQDAGLKREKLIFDRLMIDLAEYKVRSFEQNVTLTAKEMELLWYLASNAGQVFTRNQLLESIWGYTYYGDTRTVDTHIKRLRHKLAIPEDSPWDIKTIWGVGYKFEAGK